MSRLPSLRLPKHRFDELIASLWHLGYRVLGPVERDGAMLFDEVRRAADLPVGRRDVQEPGRYRLVEGEPGELFGVVNGPGSLKPFTFAPEEPLLEVRRQRRGLVVEETLPEVERTAVLGVRACDLAALAVQDRIFLHDRFHDSHYAVRRERLLLVAVNCTRSVATCFCTSMGTGPAVSRGHDLALTEIDDVLLVEAGSAAGAEVVGGLRLEPASGQEIAAGEAKIGACADSITRRLDTSDLPRLLYDEAESPRWDDVAERCLSCTNCTMVCPTCFCHSVTDVSALDPDTSRRVRQWDSCFSLEHAHIHGMNFRPHVRERYRQWLTHKVASWIDQFGTSGCVGCGRCISWCPVGIDLTEEVAAIREAARHRESP
jgi:sulfhydrogenase subunit beta (sulfur reductase)